MMATDAHEAALDLMASLVLPDGRLWGEAAAPFQWADARAVLDRASPTPYHYLTRARGGAKTGDLAGIALAAMIAQAPPGARLYALSADRDQGRLIVDSMRGFAMRTPMLRGLIEVGTFRVTLLGRDIALEVLAADAAGAWGLRPWLVVIDELAQWHSTPSARELWEAVTTALAKVTDARMAVLTSAGDPAHWSHEILEHAIADPLWRVHEVPGPAPWTDTRRLDEQRRRLTASRFAQLYLNRWTTPEDRLASLDDLRACVTLDGPQEPKHDRVYVVGLDLGLKHDRTVGVVCHAEPVFDPPETDEPEPEPEFIEHRIPVIGPPHMALEMTERLVRLRPWELRAQPTRLRRTIVGHRVVLDRIRVWEGSPTRPVQLAEVEAWVAETSRTFDRARLVFDPWQALGMAQRLAARGLLVEEFNITATSVGRLADVLMQLIGERALALPDDRELIDELSTVRVRENSRGVRRLDHDAGRHDDRAMAIALAAQHLLRTQVRDGYWIGRNATEPQRLSEDERRWRRFLEEGREPWEHGESLTQDLLGRAM